MPNNEYKRAVQAEQNVTGRRFCPNCQQNRSAVGGVWKISKNGLNRRWECALCYQRKSSQLAKDAAG